MKTIPGLFYALSALAFYVNQVQAAPAGANKSGGFQLNIELWDGSRVVGKSLEDTLSFHSVALGDLKLAWTGIRSIEYAATNTDTARLTTTDGDGFTVHLTAPILRVETGFGQIDLPVKLIHSVKVQPPVNPNIPGAPAAAKSDSRLTIELRDGSHVIGKGLDDTLNFHSSAMGDLKLTWSDIRSIEYATANADLARLTATNGDVYEVQFAAPTVRVETSFGKTELPVKLISSIKVSSMSPVSPALHAPGQVLYENSGDNTTGFSVQFGNGGASTGTLVSNGTNLVVSGGVWDTLPVSITGDFQISYEICNNSYDGDSHLLLLNEGTHGGVGVTNSPEKTDTPSINIVSATDFTNYQQYYFPTAVETLATATSQDFPNQAWTQVVVTKTGNMLTDNVGGQIIQYNMSGLKLSATLQVGLGGYATTNGGGAGDLLYRNIVVTQSSTP